MKKALLFFFVIIFTSLFNLSSGQVCGPNDISAQLASWLKPKGIISGDNLVVRWEGENETDLDLEVVEEYYPEHQVKQLNGHDVVRFEEGALLKSKSPLSLADQKQFTVFMVLRCAENTLNDGADIFSFRSAGIGELVRLEAFDNSYRMVFGGSFPSATMQVDQVSWSIITVRSGAGNQAQVYANGALELTHNYGLLPTAPVVGDVFMGRNPDNLTNNWFGDMAELVMYDRTLSLAEQQAIETQLALQFGIHIEDSAHQYFDAGGSSSNEAIAGIGQNSLACFQQHQSQSVSAGTDAMIAISNPSQLEDHEYLTWGTNDVTPSWTSSRTKPSVHKRLRRHWRVSETGEVGTIDLAFGVADRGLIESQLPTLGLLVTQIEGDYNNSREIMADAFIGDTLYFYGLNLNDGDYFTLAHGITLEDQDRDGIADGDDLDADNDGLLNLAEDPFGTERDQDGDNVPDYLDLDSDNDGLSDLEESGWDPQVYDRDQDGRIDNDFSVGQNGAVDLLETAPEAGLYTQSPRDWDQDGIIDAQDLDSDNDGMSDLQEGGLQYLLLDLNFDGVVDGDDTDGDGLIQSVDGRMGAGGLYTVPQHSDADQVADYLDLDSDNDGIGDLYESGRLFQPIDLDLDGVVDGDDDDADGVKNAIDSQVGFGGTDVPIMNHDLDARADFRDLDSDDDGVSDLIEAGYQHQIIDLNLDGVVDGDDTDTNGLMDAIQQSGGGFSQYPEDRDGDGIYNFRDRDSDQDGIYDVEEIGLKRALFDLNRDGVVDGDDTDADGIKSKVDGTKGPGGINVNPIDTDGDGVLDYVDADSDNDGIPDQFEALAASDTLNLSGRDTDQDGIDDRFDGDHPDGNPVPLEDTDQDGTPNYLDTDADGDGWDDRHEAWDNVLDGDNLSDVDCTEALDQDSDGLLSCYDADDQDILNVFLRLPPPDDNGYQGVGDYAGDSVAVKNRLADYFPDNGDRIGVPDFMDNPFTYLGGHGGQLALALKQGTNGYLITNGIVGAPFLGTADQTGVVRVTDFWVDSVGWAHYYHPAQPDQFLFSIRHGANVTPIDYVALTVDMHARNEVDTLQSKGYYILRRDWNVKTLEDLPLVDSAGNPVSVDVRFYFDLFELDYLLEQSVNFAEETMEGEVGQPRWFKTPNGTDGYEASYLSENGLTGEVDLGVENTLSLSNNVKPKGYGKVGSGQIINGFYNNTAAHGEGKPDGSGVIMYNHHESWIVELDSLLPAASTLRIRVRRASYLKQTTPVIAVGFSADGELFQPQDTTSEMILTNSGWRDIYIKTSQAARFVKISHGQLASFNDFEIDAVMIGEVSFYPNRAMHLTLSSLNENLCFKQFEGITGFSGGTMMIPVEGSSTAFPVEWLELSGVKSGADVFLNWETGAESNNQKFRIERSLDGSHFGSVGVVEAAGRAHRYQFVDQGAAQLFPKQLYYRIKQVDLDGKSSYSPVIMVKLSAYLDPLLSVYPNPAQGQINLRYLGDPQDQALELTVFNLLGKELYRQQVPATGQLEELLLSTEDWQPGVYLVRLATERQERVLKIQIQGTE